MGTPNDFTVRKNPGFDWLKDCIPSGSQVAGFFDTNAGKNVSEIGGFLGLGFILNQMSGGSGPGNLIMGVLLYAVDKLFLGGTIGNTMRDGLGKAPDMLKQLWAGINPKTALDPAAPTH